MFYCKFLCASLLQLPTKSVRTLCCAAVNTTEKRRGTDMRKIKVEGLIAAPFSPFNAIGELDTTVIKKYANHLQREHVSGVFVCGTSGENSLLSMNERKKLAEHWIEAAKDRLKYTIIQVGTENVKDTKELAKHAEEIGATGIAVLPTIYHKPMTSDALVTYLQQVSTAAPNTPLFYYHIPAWSHVTFSLEELLVAARDRIPTLAGAKFTNTDLVDYGRCLTLDRGKYQIMYAGDGMILGAHAIGATSSVGITYNYAASCAKRVVDAFNRGDMETARIEQNRLQALLHVATIYGGASGDMYLSVHKAIMSFRGIDVGPPRCPIVELDDSHKSSLKKDLQDIGFFEWCT